MKILFRVLVSALLMLAWMKVSCIFFFAISGISLGLVPGILAPFSSLLGLVLFVFGACGIYAMMHINDIFFWEKYNWFKGTK